jgi:assimilatory nitrate reductase catalytic subunit
MFQAAADGEIKALWIACTNPAQSLPDQATVRRALERAEFVVVQEAFCHHRHLRLCRPAAARHDLGREGPAPSPTASGASAACARPSPRPGRRQHNAPRHDWQIAVDFAQAAGAAVVGWPTPVALLRWGRQAHRRCPSKDSTPESLWNEHRESTRGRDLDITGLSYAMLDAAPQQWPLKQGEPHGKVAPVRRRRLPDPRRPRALCRRDVPAGGRTARRALPVFADHRAPARPLARHDAHRHAGPPVRPCRRAGGADAPAGHGAPQP